MRKVSLGKLFELKYGKSLRKDKRNPGHYPVYGSNGPVDFHDQFLVNGPTIIVGRKGSIGVVHLVTIPCWPIDTTYFVEPQAEYDFDLVWLYRLLQTLRLPELNRSAAIPGLNRDDVYRIEVPLPPLDDQKRIAHLLSKVEGLIAQRKQHLQQLDDLLKSVFLEMFGDPIRNPKAFPIKKLSEFYINPKEGTKCGPFGSALKKDELVESGISVWNMDNIDPSGRMVSPFRMWITEEKYQELRSYSVIDGDIIISRAGTVGKMCVAKMDGAPAIISTNLIRIRLGSRLRPLHIVSLMTYCKGRIGRLKTGADGAFTHMSTGILDKLEFPYPPISLQDQFAAIVEKAEVLKARYQQNLTDLENLYGALSQKAFKGELDLSRVPLPEQKQDKAAQETKVPEAIDESEYAEMIKGFSKLDMAVMSSAEGREQILRQWFGEWLNDIAATQELSPDHFWQRARYSALDYQADDDAGLDFSLQDYDLFKQWLFDAIAEGRIEQTRNAIEMDGKTESGNQIVLKKVR